MSISRTAIPLLAHAVYLIKEKNEFIESRNILKEGRFNITFLGYSLLMFHNVFILLVNGLRPDWFSCQKYLALVNIKLRSNSSAELFARQSKSSLLLIRSLVQQNVKEKTVEAIELCKAFMPSATPNNKTEFLELYAT